MHESYATDDEGNVCCDTRIQFAEFCGIGGWNSIAAFEADTGVKCDDLLGKYFTSINRRVYMRDE